MCKEKLIDFTSYIINEDGTIYSKYWKRNIELDNLTNSGYVKVTLKTINSNKPKTYLLHRVIWYYFNGNIPNGIEVGHSDCNPLNCSLINLYLCTHQQNMNHPTTRKRISSWQKGKKKNYQCGSPQKPIDQIDKTTGEVLGTWINITEAAKSLGLHRTAITDCCNGKRKTHGGFIWRRWLI